MPRLLIILTLLLAGIQVIAQTATVKGKASDRNGDPLIGAYVYVENTTYNSSVDEKGNYQITVPSGPIILTCSYINRKKTYNLDLKSGEIKELNILVDLVFNVGQAEITDYAERQKQIKPLDPKVASLMPSIRGGIEDLLIQAPVNFTSELSSSYSVRGGSFDENLVYVNDIQVYRPFLVRAGQQEGLSFPNPDMVDNILFSAGGFEAKYGDRLSSVLDIKYRKPTKFAGSASASLLGGTLQLEGVNKSKKLTHNSGFRYRNNSYVLGSLDVQGDYRPSYLDFQTFLTYKLRGDLELNFLGNIARNKYNFIPSTRETNIGTINEALRLTVFYEGQEVSQFNTGFAAASLNYQPTEKSMLRFIGSAFQTYETETFDILGQYFLDELERDFGSDEFGEVVRNRGVGGFLEHARNDLEANVITFTHKGFQDFDRSNHYLQWGANWQSESITDRLSEWNVIDSSGYFTPRPLDSLGYTNPDLQGEQLLELRDVIKGKNILNSNRVMAFVQDSWEKKFNNEALFTSTLGVRAHYWDFNNETVISPRANFSYKPHWVKERIEGGIVDTVLTKDIIFTLAGGWYYQPPFYREMRGIDGKVNPDIQAQKSIHIVGGINYVLEAWGRPFKLVSEIYYKDLDNMIPYEVENVRLRYYARNNSSGYATGLDVMMNGEFIPGVQSWFRASVLKTEEDLNDDQYYEYYNADGELIIPGFTFDQNIADSTLIIPGNIPRPTDQRFSFSMFFQDEMPRWPEYKVQITFYYGTGLPYGPPTFERYKDILRTTAYRRVDIGFSRQFITEKNKDQNWFSKTFDDAFVSLEIFNILAINNTINHTWIEDVDGRLYSIPNFLTGRRLNLKFAVRF
jgi:hypothetical protein